MSGQEVTKPRGSLPAWTLLERASIRALLSAQGGMPDAIRIAPDAPPSEIAAVPLVSAARSMIERAVAHDGLILTARGALSRADTAALFEVTPWPDYSKQSVRSVSKVLNEADILPVHFTRQVAQGVGLLRGRAGRLIPTKKGKALLVPDQAPALLRLLFETVFWRVNLGYFDRVPVEHWPQTHIGIVLWCLSVTAHTWAEPEVLVQACTIPDEALAGAAFDYPRFAMEARVLRPLTWFGLMECLVPADTPGSGYVRRYRKSALFDRVLRFEVAVRSRTGLLQ